MDPIQFDQLPDLCLWKIFSFLGLRDLVRCRAVSRQFKFYVDRTKVTELVVRRLWRGNVSSEKWLRTNSSIDFVGAISLGAFRSAKSSLFKLDQQLKFLHITGRLSNDATYAALSRLQQLIHLEICSKSNELITRTLVLPNLKVLSIDGPNRYVLKTPKLEVLSCEEMSQIRIDYPETIKLISCFNKGGLFSDLTKLRGLEVLIVYLGTYGALDGISLSDLTALRELNLTYNLYKKALQKQNGMLFMSPVLNLMHEKIALQRDDLKMYLNEVLLVDTKQLADLKVLFDSSIANNEDLKEIENAFKLINYRLLNDCPEVTSLNLNLLMRLDFEITEISEDFFSRFPQIRSITATKLVDLKKFEWFLQNATELRTLKLTDTALDRAFIEHLLKLCSRLTHLEVNDSSDLVTKFQFLLQLEALQTKRPLHPFVLAAVAFRQSAELKSFRFRTGDVLVKIERSSALEDNYTLRLFGIVGKRKITQTFRQENLNLSQLFLYE